MALDTSLRAWNADRERTPNARSAGGRVGQSRRVVLLAVLVAGLAAGANGGFQPASELASRFMQAYVNAQLTMLEATSNVTADGKSEYAVLFSEGEGADAIRRLVEPMPGIDFIRESQIGGWAVVAAAPDARDRLDDLRAHARVRLVIPNRGLWICH